MSGDFREWSEADWCLRCHLACAMTTLPRATFLASPLLTRPNFKAGIAGRNDGLNGDAAASLGTRPAPAERGS